MKKRWDFLYVLGNYSYLEELECLIAQSKILGDDSNALVMLCRIREVKKEYPFESRRDLPTWNIDRFTVDVLLLVGDLKKVMPIPQYNPSPHLPAYEPSSRVWEIIEGFFDSAKKRKTNHEEEVERASLAMLQSTKLHTYYAQLGIAISTIVLGIVIGWLFL